MGRMGFIDLRRRGGRSAKEDALSGIASAFSKRAERKHAADLSREAQDKAIQANRDAAAEREAADIRKTEDARAYAERKQAGLNDIAAEKAAKEAARDLAIKKVDDAKSLFKQHISLAQTINDPTDRAQAIKEATNIYKQLHTRPEIARFYSIPTDQEASNTAIEAIGVRKSPAVSSASKNSFALQQSNDKYGGILANQVSLDDENYRMLQNGTGAGVGKFSNMSIQGVPESETGRTGSKRQQMLMDSTADINGDEPLSAIDLHKTDAWKRKQRSGVTKDNLMPEANLMPRDMGFRDRTIMEAELAYRLNPHDERFVTETYEQKQKKINLDTANRLNEIAIQKGKVVETNAETARINAGLAESKGRQDAQNNLFIKLQNNLRTFAVAIANQYGTNEDPEGMKNLIAAAENGNQHAIYLLDGHDKAFHRMTTGGSINNLIDEEFNIPPSAGGGAGGLGNPHANITKAMGYVPSESNEGENNFRDMRRPPEEEVLEPVGSSGPPSIGGLYGSELANSNHLKPSQRSISKGKDLMNKIPSDVLAEIWALYDAGKKDQASALRDIEVAKLGTK
tara:strand:- start:12067 stop:13773 length:1707 start_codon:yes stop_codon:yes gene_type:complete